MTMQPLLLQAHPPTLNTWGKPEQLGGQTLTGDVQISGLTLLGSGTTKMSAGWFAATQGCYRLVYPFHEHATLAEGQLILTDEKSGESIEYGPGDSWIIPKGAQIIWEILSPRAVKHYMVSFDDLPVNG